MESHCPLEETAGDTSRDVHNPGSQAPGLRALSPDTLSAPLPPTTPHSALWVTDQALCKYLFSKVTHRGKKTKL